MLHNRDELLAAARPQPIPNLDTQDMLPYSRKPEVNPAPMAPRVVSRPLAAPQFPAPLAGSEPTKEEESLPPLMPASVLDVDAIKSSISPLVTAEVQRRAEAAQLREQMGNLPPLLSAGVMEGADPYVFSKIKESLWQETPEAEKELESSIGWLTRRTGEGLVAAGPTALLEFSRAINLPWTVGAVIEGQITGESDGWWHQQAKLARDAEAAYMAEHGVAPVEGQTNWEKLRDPGIIIPAIASFGSQIAMMFAAGGGLGAAAKGVGMSVAMANRLATAAGAIYGGVVEGQDTYYRGLELGMTPGEAGAAFAKHATISGVMGLAELSFLFNKMPAPLQQKLLRRFAAGTTDAVSESLDETAGAWSLDSDLGWKEALKITGDAFAEIGPAAFIVGMFTGNIGLPPEQALKAATATSVQSQINYAGEGKSVLDQVGEERLKAILEGEATYFRTADGVRHSTIDGEARGGVVEGDAGYYWIPGRYGKKDGELLPVRLSDIIEVGTTGNNAEDIVTYGSEHFQALKLEAENTVRDVFGNVPELRTRTFEEAFNAEREIALRRIIAESAAKRQANQEAEFQRFTELMDQELAASNAAADNIRGVDEAVRTGFPEMKPDAPMAGDLPPDIDAKMFAQLDKLAEAEWRSKLGTTRWLEITPEMRAQKKRTTIRRLAGMRGSITKLQNQVAEGIKPAEPGTFAAEVEAMIANYGLTGVSTPIDQLLEEDYTAKAMAEAEREITAKLRIIENAGRRVSNSMVQDSSGNSYSLSAAAFGPVANMAPPVLTQNDIEGGADTLAAQKAVEPLDTATPESSNLSSGDWTRVLLTYAGGENMMEALKNGETTVEEIMMQAFQNAGKLKFVPNGDKSRLIASKGMPGQTDDRYNASMMAFVKAVREAKTALHYVMENEYSEEYGLQDVEMYVAGAMPPRASQVGQETLFSSRSTRDSEMEARLAKLDPAKIASLATENNNHYNYALKSKPWLDELVAELDAVAPGAHKSLYSNAANIVRAELPYLDLLSVKESENEAIMKTVLRKVMPGIASSKSLINVIGQLPDADVSTIVMATRAEASSIHAANPDIKRKADEERAKRAAEDSKSVVNDLDNHTYKKQREEAKKEARTLALSDQLIDMFFAIRNLKGTSAIIAQRAREAADKALDQPSLEKAEEVFKSSWETINRLRRLGGDTLKSTAPGKTTRKKTIKRQKSTEATHGFAATMKKSNLYHQLVQAGAKLGWDDHYAAAEIASEIVYAQANAWVSADPGSRTVSEYYDKYLGRLIAEAEEVSKEEYEIRQATKGYAIVKEMLFSLGFRVAAKKDDGTVVIAEPGEIHAILSWRDKSITAKHMGFVDAAGTFMTRAEALQRIALDDPSIIPPSRRDMELDSVELEDYDTEGMLYSLENRRNDYVSKVMNTPGKVLDLVYKLDMYSRHLKNKRSDLMTEAWKHARRLEKANYSKTLDAEFEAKSDRKEQELTDRIEALDIEIDDVYAQKLSLLSTSRFVQTDKEKTSSVYGPDTLRAAFNLTKAEASAVHALFKASGLNSRNLLVGSIKEFRKGGGYLYGMASLKDWRIDSDYITLGKSYIGGTAIADVNTALHELAHVFRKRIFLASATVDQDVFVKPATLALVKEWAGADKDAYDLTWGKEAEEKFANGFVQYIRSGLTETAELETVFEVISKWMSDAYAIDRVYSRGERTIDVSPEMAAVFDNMLNKRKGKLFSEGAVYSGHEQQILGSFDPTTKNIELFLGSDLHTVLHEFSHAWRRSLDPKQEKIAGEWANGKGWKVGMPWTVKGEERFADGFVAWAGDANAKVPPEMKDVFSAAARYLTGIYSTGRALRPDVKVSAALSSTMEKLITRQLIRSANVEDKEEGIRRQRVSAEFKKGTAKDLGDHIDMMAEFLNMPPQSPQDRIDLQEEYLSRKKNPKYREELDAKLLEWESTGRPAIDLVDFLIVRDRAIDIRVKFEGDFREAYRKGPDAVNKLITKMAKDRTQMDIRFYRMVAGDAGRRLQLLTNKATEIDTAVLLANMEKQYGSKSFDVLYSMLQDPQNAWSLADKMAGEFAPTMWDMYMQAYYGFRLSSPDVLAVNFFGTGLWTMWNYTIHRPFAGMIDLGIKAMSNVTSWGKVLDRFYFRGNPRTRDHFNTSVLPLYAQLGRSIPYGAGLAWQITSDKTGGVHTLASVKNMDITTRDVNSWQRFTMRREGLTARMLRRVFGQSNGEAAIQKWEDTIRSLGPLTSIATTMMRASDMFFKVIAVEGEMNRIAQEEAMQMFPRNPVAQSHWIKSRTAAIVKDPGQLSAAQAERLAKVAEYNTFTDMPLKASRYMLGYRESIPIVKLVFPYFNTLVNLGKRGLEMIPGIGLVMEGMYRTDPQYIRNSYGHTKADIIAKQLEGAMMAAMMFLLFDEDELTGAAPTDPTERKLFYEAGKIEYALKFGDTWVSYANIQPFNVAFSVVADLRKYVFSNIKNMGSDSVELQEKVNRDLMQAGWSIGSFLLNNDFMRGFEQYANAKTYERQAKVLGTTIESALIPYNGFVRWMMKTEKMMQNEDGYFVQQERDSLSETAFPVSHNILNAIFGLPLTEMNRLTVWGEPYSYSDNKWYDFWMPVQYSADKLDEVDSELEKLGYVPEKPDRTYTVNNRRYQFDREIWQQYVLGYGAESKPKVARLIKSPGFQRKHKEDKVAAIQAVMRDVREKHSKKAKAAQRKAGLNPIGE